MSSLNNQASLADFPLNEYATPPANREALMVLKYLLMGFLAI
jgi:hypothetical protein